ncbi:hypothetical protein Emed_000427 [Eimeria media]
MERPRSPYATGWGSGGLGLCGSYSKRRLYNQLALETPSARRQAEHACAAGLLGRTTSPTLLRHQETTRRRFQSLNAQPDPPPLARHSAARAASREGRSKGPPGWGAPSQDPEDGGPLKAPFACRSPRSCMQPTTRSGGLYKDYEFGAEAFKKEGTRLVPRGSSSPRTSAAQRPSLQDSIRRQLETPRWGDTAEETKEDGDFQQQENTWLLKEPNSDKQGRDTTPRKVREKGDACFSFEKEDSSALAGSSQRREEERMQQRFEAPLPEAATTHANDSGSPDPRETRRRGPSPERDAERGPSPGRPRGRDTDGDRGDTEGHAPLGDLHDSDVREADRVAWRVAELQRQAQLVLGRETLGSSSSSKRGASPAQHSPYLTTGFGAPLDATDLVEKMRARDEKAATLESIRRSLSPVSVSERAAHKAEVLGLQTKAQNYYLLYRKVLERQAPLEAEIKRLRKCLEEERANSRRLRPHSPEKAPVAPAEGSPKDAAEDSSKRELGPTVDVQSSVLMQSLLGVCHSLVPVFAREAQFCGEESDPLPGSPIIACMLRVIDYVAASSHLNPAVEQARRELAAALRGRRTPHATHWQQLQQQQQQQQQQEYMSEKPFSFSSPREGRGRDRGVGLLQAGGSRARSQSAAVSPSPLPVSPRPHWQLGLQQAAKAAGDSSKPRETPSGRRQSPASEDEEWRSPTTPSRQSLLQRRALARVGEKDVLAKARLMAAAAAPFEETHAHAFSPKAARHTPRNRGFRGLSPLPPKGAPQQQAGGLAALTLGKRPEKKVTYLLPPAEPQGKGGFADPFSLRPQPVPSKPTPSVPSIQVSNPPSPPQQEQQQQQQPQQQQQQQHQHVNLPPPSFSPAASLIPSPPPPTKAADLVPSPKTEASPPKKQTPAAPKKETVSPPLEKEASPAAQEKEAPPPAPKTEPAAAAVEKEAAAAAGKKETGPPKPQEEEAKPKDKQAQPPPAGDKDTPKETPVGPKPSQPKEPEEEPTPARGPVSFRLSHLKSLKGDDPGRRTFQFVLHGAKEDPLLLAQQQGEEGRLVTERHTTRLEPKGGPARVCNVEEELTIPVEKEKEGVCLSILEVGKDGSSKVFATSGKLPLETVGVRLLLLLLLGVVLLLLLLLLILTWMLLFQLLLLPTPPLFLLVLVLLPLAGASLLLAAATAPAVRDCRCSLLASPPIWGGGPMLAEIDIRKASPSGDKETVARLVATLGRASPQQQQRVGAAATAASEKTPGAPAKGRESSPKQENKPTSPPTKSKEAKQQQSPPAAAATAAATAAKEEPKQQAPKEGSKESALARKFSAATLSRMRAMMEAESGDRDRGDDPKGRGDSEKRQGRLARLLRGTGLRLRRRKRGIEGRDSYKDPEVRRRVRELIEAGIWKTGDDEEYELVLDEEAREGSPPRSTGKANLFS